MIDAGAPVAAAAQPKTRIVLIEPHEILRDGLRALIEMESDLCVVASACDAMGATTVVPIMRPALLITEIALPDRSGISLISELLALVPGMRLLALTSLGNEEYIRAALNAGAHGYVLKDSGRADLMRAIRTVAAGRQFLCSSVAAKVLSGFVGGIEVKRSPPAEALVTGRERQVLIRIALGQSNKLIARDLGLSVKTVEKHRANLMRKLTLHNAAAVTLFALRHGFIGPDAIQSTGEPLGATRLMPAG